MTASTRDPSTPQRGAARSFLAGLFVTGATTIATRYGGPEAGELAGRVAEGWLEPALWSLVGGAVLAVSTWVRKVRADAVHMGSDSRLLGILLVALVLPGCATIAPTHPDPERLETLAEGAALFALADRPDLGRQIAAVTLADGPDEASLGAVKMAVWSHLGHALDPADHRRVAGIVTLLEPDLSSLVSRGELPRDAIPLAPILRGIQRGAARAAEGG